MNDKILKPVFLVLLLGSSTAFAGAGKVTISSPADGAMVGTKDKVMVKYEADVGDTGDHLHLNLDGKRIDVIRPLKGTTEVAPLKAGKHQICLAVNTKGHVPTGTESCINVTAQ